MEVSWQQPMAGLTSDSPLRNLSTKYKVIKVLGGLLHRILMIILTETIGSKAQPPVENNRA
ncbi:hypothetical protein C7271_16675 [filamentous cyanobacterium CCP5]|nr:hypothetical protein C7271_16675 [filamentous cyanobacterium CCP5]